MNLKLGFYRKYDQKYNRRLLMYILLLHLHLNKELYNKAWWHINIFKAFKVRRYIDDISRAGESSSITNLQ